MPDSKPDERVDLQVLSEWRQAVRAAALVYLKEAQVAYEIASRRAPGRCVTGVARCHLVDARKALDASAEAIVPNLEALQADLQYLRQRSG